MLIWQWVAGRSSDNCSAQPRALQPTPCSLAAGQVSTAERRWCARHHGMPSRLDQRQACRIIVAPEYLHGLISVSGCR